MTEPSYDAFISYSRKDAAIALRLQRRLEALQPRAAREAPRLRVFVDSQELSASPSLNQSIRRALEVSRFLVVVASPHAAKSEWVLAEIGVWLALGRRDRLLFVVVDGEPTELLPTMFARDSAADPGDEPLAADVRAPSLRARLRRLEEEYFRIAAPLLGVAFDDLRQRAARQRLQRLRRIIVGLSATLLVVLAASSAAVWQWRVATTEQRAAERRLTEAIGVADDVLAGVDSKLRGVAGAESLRLALVGDATEMLDRLAREGSARTTLVETQLEAHLRSGTIAADARDFTAAERALAAAARLLPALATEVGRARGRALIERARGELAFSRKGYAEAEHHFGKAEELAHVWAASGSEQAAELACADLLRLRGDAKAFLRRWGEAGADYAKAQASYQALLARGRETTDLLLGAAVVEERLSRVAEVRRNADQVIDRMLKSTALADRVVAETTSPEALILLVELYSRLSELCTRWKQAELAAKLDRKSLDLVFSLWMTSPQNARYQLGLSQAWARLGDRARDEKQLARAKTLFALQTYMTERLLKVDPNNLALGLSHVEGMASLVDVLLKSGNPADAREQFSSLTRAVDNLSGELSQGASDEQWSLVIRAHNLVGEAARRLGLTVARSHAYESALSLAKARFAREPDDMDARIDLLAAHSNMVLAAAGINDASAMRVHAEAAAGLLPHDLEGNRDERELIEGIRQVLEQVLGPLH